MSDNGFVQTDYYAKRTKSDGSILIVHVEKESTVYPKEAFGRVVFFSANCTEENTVWRAKKANMANSSYEFSKRGFEIPIKFSTIPLRQYAKSEIS